MRAPNTGLIDLEPKSSACQIHVFGKAIKSGIAAIPKQKQLHKHTIPVTESPKFLIVTPQGNRSGDKHVLAVRGAVTVNAHSNAAPQQNQRTE